MLHYETHGHQIVTLEPFIKNVVSIQNVTLLCSMHTNVSGHYGTVLFNLLFKQETNFFVIASLILDAM